MNNKHTQDDLRKLIKYDERMGVRSTQHNYYENLFRKTTASYRAKIDKDNKTSEKISNLNDILDRIDRIGETVTATNDQESILRLRPRSGAENKENHRPIEVPVKNQRQQSSTKTILDDYYRDWQSQRTLKKDKDDAPTRLGETRRANKEAAITTPDTKHPKKPAKEMDSGKNRSPTWKERMSFSDEKPIQNQNANQPNVRAVIHDAIVQELQHQFEKTFKIDLKKKMAYDGSEGKATASATSNNVYTSSSEVLGKNMSGKRHHEGMTKGPRRAPQNTPLSTSTSRSRTVSPRAVTQNGRAYSVLIARNTFPARMRKPDKSDPVSLYQYYKSEWDHFRKQIPGEDCHHDLRWNVRQRLMHSE